MARILIVEDDTSINHMLAELLTEDGYDVVQAFSGTEALLQLRLEPIDLILLDLMLPGKPGEEVFAEVREKSDVPVIMLTAKDAVSDKVRLLKMGVDDYLTKPFVPQELLARIEAVLRRVEPGSTRNDFRRGLTYHELHLDPEAMTASLCGEPLNLTNYEFEILHLLMTRPGKVFTKNRIFETVWGFEYRGEENALNTHISNLRKKMHQITPDEYIETVWGLGFKLHKSEA